MKLASAILHVLSFKKKKQEVVETRARDRDIQSNKKRSVMYQELGSLIMLFVFVAFPLTFIVAVIIQECVTWPHALFVTL